MPLPEPPGPMRKTRRFSSASLCSIVAPINCMPVGYTPIQLRIPPLLPLVTTPVTTLLLLYQFQTLLIRYCCNLSIKSLYRLFLDFVGWVAPDGPKREAAMDLPSPPLR